LIKTNSGYCAKMHVLSTLQVVQIATVTDAFGQIYVIINRA